MHAGTLISSCIHCCMNHDMGIICHVVFKSNIVTLLHLIDLHQKMYEYSSFDVEHHNEVTNLPIVQPAGKYIISKSNTCQQELYSCACEPQKSMHGLYTQYTAMSLGLLYLHHVNSRPLPSLSWGTSGWVHSSRRCQPHPASSPGPLEGLFRLIS